MKNKELNAKFPHAIKFYGHEHIGKINWWQKLKMRYKLRKLMRQTPGKCKGCPYWMIINRCSLTTCAKGDK